MWFFSLVEEICDLLMYVFYPLLFLWRLYFWSHIYVEVKKMDIIFIVFFSNVTFKTVNWSRCMRSLNTNHTISSIYSHLLLLSPTKFWLLLNIVYWPKQKLKKVSIDFVQWTVALFHEIDLNIGLHFRTKLLNIGLQFAWNSHHNTDASIIHAIILVQMFLPRES